MRIALILLLTLRSLAVAAAPDAGFDFARAEDPGRELFTADHWSRGIHLFVGIGVDGAIYNRSDIVRKDLGIGLGITTASGFVLNNDWMIEFTSNLGFHSVDNFYLWDSLFAPGVRFRIPNMTNTKDLSAYGRALLGWGMAVELPKGADYRVDLTGPVFGLGFGLLRGKAKESVWFIEALLYVHSFRVREIVRNSDTTAIVDSKSKLGGSWSLTGVCVAVGVLAF